MIFCCVVEMEAKDLSRFGAIVLVLILWRVGEGFFAGSNRQYIPFEFGFDIHHYCPHGLYVLFYYQPTNQLVLDEAQHQHHPCLAVSGLCWCSAAQRK